MKKQVVKSILCSYFLALLLSCSSEQNNNDAAKGTLNVHLHANSGVLTGSRSVDNEEEEGIEGNLPDVSDFAFEILRGETSWARWNTFSDYEKDDEYTLRPGSYIAKASYGDKRAEGFEKPYFEGSQSFVIQKGQVTDVNVTAYLANAKFSMAYTDEFKKYFSTYRANVLSSLNNTITFEKEETRYAYFQPGHLYVSIVVNKAGIKEPVTLAVKDFDAVARHAYLLTLDVDAGTPVLKVKFSDDVADETVEINVSDEALNSDPPRFVEHGFKNDEESDLVEGVDPKERVYAYLDAVSNLQKCILVVNSKSMEQLGLGGTIELSNPTVEQRAAMQKYGLITKGLDANKEIIATIDFTKLLSFLEYNNEDPLSTLTLIATNIFAKQNQTVLKVRSVDNEFSVVTKGMSYGTQTIDLDVTLIGGMDKLVYYWKDGISWQQMAVASSTTDEDNKTHHVTLNVPTHLAYDTEVKVQCILKERFGLVDVAYPNPVCTLEHEGDIWAKKALITVKGAEYSMKDIMLQYSLDGTNWINSVQGTSTETVLTAKGLPSNTPMDFRVTYTEKGSVPVVSNVIKAITEVELKPGNMGFEEWSEAKSWTAASFGGKTIYAFYPFKSGASDADKWWTTRNQQSTKKLSGTYYSWYYATYPGTVPTNATSMHTATWHLNKYDGKIFEIKSNSGNVAMEIATVGWGFNNWGPGGGSDPQRRTAGALFIGTSNEDSETFGKAFKSRPTSVSFYYKYYSYNGERTAPYAKVFDNAGEEIGYGEYLIDSSIGSFTQGRINISYTVPTKKAASITVVFLSTSSDSPGIKQVKGDNGLVSGYGDSRHIGSILTIDDVDFEY